MQAAKGIGMKNSAGPSNSHLFLVRLWTETGTGGGRMWAGKVQQVLDGETRYFRDWMTMIYEMNEMMRGGEIVQETEMVGEDGISREQGAVQRK